MNRVPALRVAVAGVGVAGAAVALALARCGAEVHAFEAAPTPRDDGTGVLLQPTGLAMLALLGLAEPVRRHGAAVHRLFGDTASGRTVLDMRYARLGPGVAGLGVQRPALLQALWQALGPAGVQWHLGCPVEGRQADGAGVHVRLAAEAAPGASGRAAVERPFDLLVLASGSFTALRSGVGLAGRVQPYPWGALWCLVPQPRDWPAGLLRQRYRGAQEMLGLMPAGTSPGCEVPQLTLFWSLSPAALARWRQAPELEPVTRHITALWPEAAALLEGVSSPDRLRVARYADVSLPRWHGPREVVIGDAAHAMSPQLGQGANMALLDALALTEALQRRGLQPQAVPEALAAYSRERRGHLRFYQRASRWLTPLFQSDRRAGPALRDAAFGIGGRWPWIERESMAALAGMKTGWLAGRLRLPQPLLAPPVPRPLE